MDEEKNKIQQLLEEVKLLNERITFLQLKRQFPNALDALVYLTSNTNEELQQIYNISQDDIKLTKECINDALTYTELYREHVSPLIIACVARLREEEMICLEECIILIKSKKIAEDKGKEIIKLLGENKKKLVEFKMEISNKEEKKEEQIIRTFGIENDIERPISAQNIEFKRLEERLQFENITTLSHYVTRQNPRVVYFEKQLNVTQLINSINGKENIMLICRTTNSNIFFGTYCQKKIIKNSFGIDDPSFFMFVTNKKDLYCFIKKSVNGSTFMISDKKENKVIEVDKCFSVAFQITNAFMNTKVLKCSFSKELNKYYIEKDNKELPFKIGNSISYEVLSVYALQWN
ncbi:hypothetical protein EHI8A_103800 [Entamoeba histolytica HM-1:IMSS-B]|uniref:Uncharacterized protein n=6 Tax=Entamoeba histolytica TaxID=5759 RepID=C4M6Y7_ENTH1|nr:hypothetical protein EHI_056370 [Entamoeba histolytica HM-1:IMSS]EMH73647.1 hypothetical protein EHI8A_103800 [Entamoeba histolytica HM-1:IMSS-B]EMS16440.1 hypothetical protein KM1_173730 [Entamoeba histolytica HM-3:IMSS]ENY60730.1 hypothetical protein EHI7A_103390 [Entamoeba histolytica HM-1:IMSS-A]GAT97268.1 hypothetical protein CL6EHI_056370 [Entamoeba histolytica]EAL45349.1 hypothetical protein EHI_056370 [Entamoeba histolytica HM-1:IMSS]|eukprot:XP_650735.1 hypothetical protein EHI_056370 [Entamoeba histolytica HM-1:IMSS]